MKAFYTYLFMLAGILLVECRPHFPRNMVLFGFRDLISDRNGQLPQLSNDLAGQNQKSDMLEARPEPTPSTHHNDGGEDENILCYVLFFGFLFVTAGFLEWIVTAIPYYPPPISVIWFIYGMILYAITQSFGAYMGLLGRGILAMRLVDSSVVYFIFLPILLYEATQTINWFKFKSFLGGGLALSVLGVGFQVLILGPVFYYAFMYQEKQNPWAASFLLAATLSSTDPIAVLSILHSVGAPEKLSVMFEGESLINDGSSVLLFQLFIELTAGVVESPDQVIFSFIKLLLLGPAFGVAVGMILFVWLSFFRKSYITQVISLLAGGYLSFFVSEFYLGLSGPLCVVCYGLWMRAYGHIALGSEVEEMHHDFVKGLAQMGNQALFIISGIISWGMFSESFSDHFNQWGNLAMAYAFLLLARTAMLFVFLPILKKSRYPLNLKEFILMVWGGLRGGIVLALGLRIEQAPKIELGLTAHLSFYTSGSVLLFLVAHGMTFELLFRLLNPYPINPFRRVYLQKAMRLIDYQYMEERFSLDGHWLFRGTNILESANRLIPLLGKHPLTNSGNLKIDLPDIGAQIRGLQDFKIDSWAMPCGNTDDTGQPTTVGTIASGRVAPSEIIPHSACKTNTAEYQREDLTSFDDTESKNNYVERISNAGDVSEFAHAIRRSKTESKMMRYVSGNSELPKRTIKSYKDNPQISDFPGCDASDIPSWMIGKEQQEREAHSVAARSQGLKKEETYFDPKLNLRLIEHATSNTDHLVGEHGYKKQISDMFNTGTEQIDGLTNPHLLIDRHKESIPQNDETISITGKIKTSEQNIDTARDKSIRHQKTDEIPVLSQDSELPEPGAVPRWDTDATIYLDIEHGRITSPIAHTQIQHDNRHGYLEPRRLSIWRSFIDLISVFGPKTAYDSRNTLDQNNKESAKESQLNYIKDNPNKIIQNQDSCKIKTEKTQICQHGSNDLSDESNSDEAESNMEMLPTPRTSISKVPPENYTRRVLRKEREGELYLLTFNACLEMYNKLYSKNCIGGSSLLNLKTSLSRAVEYALNKVRHKPIEAWAEVLKDYPGTGFNDRHTNPARLDGFAYEWQAIRCKLACISRQWIQWVPTETLRSFFLYPACQRDMECILAYVDVHEELMDKGGHKMRELLGEELMQSFEEQIVAAKRFVVILRRVYPHAYKYALLRIGTTLLLNLKEKLVKEQSARGLLLPEDKKKALDVLNEQRFRISRYRHQYFAWIPSLSSISFLSKNKM